MLNLPTVDAAGGLVIDRQGRLLFIFKDGRWDFPKGLIERSSIPSDTARKEVEEETGLPADALRHICELIPTIHLSKFSKERSLKRTRWFLLQYQNKESRFKPQLKEGIEHCEWIARWDLQRPLANCPARIHYLVNFWLKVREEISAAFGI